MSLRKSIIYSFVLLCLTLSVVVYGQDDKAIKAEYTKVEQLIPMRDGVKLFTSIYLPKDKSRKYPIMLSRTPYSVAPYGSGDYKTTLGPSPLFEKEKYIFVYQDVRGKFMSEGEYLNRRLISDPI